MKRQSAFWLICIPVGTTAVLVMVFNFALYHSPHTTVSNNDTIDLDLLDELRGLKSDISRNADLDMQELYPEGYIFMNSLYGLAWCNFLDRLPNDSTYYQEGHEQIQHAYNKISSQTGRSAFTEELPLRYGAFYTGWSTYLLGRKLKLESIGSRKTDEVITFQQQCDSIAIAIGERIYPATYYGQAWPADVVVCVASLALHDKIFTPRYTKSIERWLTLVKEHLDPIRLVPHAANPFSGKSIQNARGSSMSLMLIFLNDIDKSFAKEQFEIYADNFIDKKLGLTGIREYPKGDFSFGDVDSGPIFLQFGSAATLVGMQTLSLYSNVDTSVLIRNTIESIGMPMTNHGQKHYLFGLMPMADAFITWSHSSMPYLSTEVSFVEFHMYSVLILLILALSVWLISRKC